MALMRMFIQGPVKPSDVPIILSTGTIFSLAVVLIFLIVAKASGKTFLVYAGFAANAAFNLLTPVGDALWPILDLDTSALLFYLRHALLFLLILSLINDMKLFTTDRARELASFRVVGEEENMKLALASIFTKDLEKGH